MELLRSGLKTVLGSSDTQRTADPAETIEQLVERVATADLLEDRRDACRALKSLSRDYRVEVGAQGMNCLVDVLRKDSQDREIVSYALETLCNIIGVSINGDIDEDDENGGEGDDDAENIGEQFTEMFIKVPEHVGLVMSCMELFDLKVRRCAIHLLTALLVHKLRKMQQIVLESRMGLSKLMDLLGDSNEVIRNDVLLLLVHLTKGNSSIQKIVAFENGYDRLYEIMQSEGYIDGSIIVQDCLVVLLNLLKQNASNVQLFRDGAYIQRLQPLLQVPQQFQWSTQKIAIVQGTLAIFRILVSPSNAQQQLVSDCQQLIRRTGLLQCFFDILLQNEVPVSVLEDTINTLAELIRGDNESQQLVGEIVVPGSPARPLLLGLLLSMVAEKQPFELRCAIMYCFQCYLQRNAQAQASVVESCCQVEPSSAIGQLLQNGLCAADSLSNWFALVSFMHAIFSNSAQQERLLEAPLREQQPPCTLLEYCTRCLQQDSYALKARVALLMLFSVWSAHCPKAVQALVECKGTLSYLTAQICANGYDDSECLVQGMCAFLLGLIIKFGDTLSPERRIELEELIAKRIGREVFCNKLTDVTRHEAYIRASRQPQLYARHAGELLLDYEYCRLFKDLEGSIAKLGKDTNVEANGGSNLDASQIIAQYKDIIRDMDLQLQSMQRSIGVLQEKNTELALQLNTERTQNIKLEQEKVSLLAQFGTVEEEFQQQQQQLAQQQQQIAGFKERQQQQQEKEAYQLPPQEYLQDPAAAAPIQFPEPVQANQSQQLLATTAVDQPKPTQQTIGQQTEDHQHQQQEAPAVPQVMTDERYEEMIADQEALLELISEQEALIAKYEARLKELEIKLS